jgi:hypothetical protein
VHEFSVHTKQLDILDTLASVAVVDGSVEEKSLRAYPWIHVLGAGEEINVDTQPEADKTTRHLSLIEEWTIMDDGDDRMSRSDLSMSQLISKDVWMVLIIAEDGRSAARHAYCILLEGSESYEKVAHTTAWTGRVSLVDIVSVSLRRESWRVASMI